VKLTVDNGASCLVFSRKLHSATFTLNPFPREWFRGLIEYESQKIIHRGSQKVWYSSILWIYNLWGWLKSSLIDEYIEFERRVIIYVLYHNIRNDWNKR
jgi:hypothetical protein